MTRILPYSKQTSFTVQSADSMAQSNGTSSSSSSSSNWSQKLKESISDGVKNAESTIKSWYNKITGK